MKPSPLIDYKKISGTKTKEVQVTTKEKRISNILEESGRIIIAEPSNAESQEQVIETAKALAADGRVHYLRAGI